METYMDRIHGECGATAAESLFGEQQNAYSTFHREDAILCVCVWGGGGGEQRHLIVLLLIKWSSSSGVSYLSLYADIFLVLFFQLTYSNANSKKKRILRTVCLRCCTENLAIVSICKLQRGLC
jgi:hypothetical protein